jgi:hypothetical protein
MLLLLVRFRVGHIEPENIDAGIDQLPKFFLVAGSGADRGNDLCSRDFADVGRRCG